MPDLYKSYTSLTEYLEMSDGSFELRVFNDYPITVKQLLSMGPVEQWKMPTIAAKSIFVLRDEVDTVYIYRDTLTIRVIDQLLPEHTLFMLKCSNGSK